MNQDYIVSCIIPIASLIVAIITLIVAIYIPRKIKIDQQFSSLIEQYRSPEIGYAIHSIFHFFVIDCEQNPDNIKKKYVERFNEEIGFPMKDKIDPAKTLHFQRRLISYFYWDLAKLIFESRFPCLKKKQYSQMVEKNELNLINLILHMSEANIECFVKYKNIPELQDNEVSMNKLLKRLLNKTKNSV